MTEFLHPRDHRADGSAYGRPGQHANALWTEVGPGKPMGELLRRYWHPIALAETVTDLPRAVKVLGEDLVLFRDGIGASRPGLSALHAPWHDAALRQGRGTRHPLLLPRLAVRRRRPLPRAALRAAMPVIRCATASASPGIRSRNDTA